MPGEFRLQVRHGRGKGNGSELGNFGSVTYDFHEEEAGGAEGDVGRVTLAAGLEDEADGDHRRRRQEEELDREQLHAPLLLRGPSVDGSVVLLSELRATMVQ